MIELVHGLMMNYMTTVTRVVGVTTEIGKRGGLPEPAPNDVDCIWLALNGNDANPGTQALPKLTFSAAIAAVITHKVVHIFRNGYVGELIFNISTIDTLLSGKHIQVEEGETATLLYATGAQTRTMGNNIINGLTIKCSLLIANDQLYIFGTSWLSLENCNLISNGTPIRWNTTQAGATLRLKYTFAQFHNIQIAIHLNCQILNSIVVRGESTVGGADGIVLQYNASTPVAQTITIMRSIFYGFDVAIRFFDNTRLTSGDAHTAHLRSSVFFQCNYALLFGEASAGTAYHKLDYNYSYLSVLISDYQIGTSGGSASIEIGQDDTLAVTLPRLYVDEAAGIDGDPAGFRLQMQGKTAPGGGRYLISSPFVGDGAGGEDVAPWDETTTGPTLAWADLTTIVWSPANLQISATPINPVETTDIRGSYHNTFDGIRRQFAFQFESYCNNENARKLIKVMNDRGSVKLYPVGRINSLFTDAISGYFDATDDSFAPASGLGYMIPYNWSGFWIELNGSDYYIESNDSTKLYLIDKLGAGWPTAGTYNFAVRYILVQPRRDPIVMNQANFTAFTQGGAWREKADTQGAAFEYADFAITFLETEDLVENR